METAESASINDYIAESGNIAALHNQISSCDAILARMEGDAQLNVYPDFN